jgi:hypothetical protein
MAQTIKIKRSGTSGNKLTGSNSIAGEIGMNTADKSLYIQTGSTDASVVTVYDDSILHLDDTNNRVGIGTTSPTKSLHLSYNSSSISNTGDGLAGGAAGGGLLIQNTNTTNNTYANLDFRAATSDGRIVYQYTGIENQGDFHFITDNTNSPESQMVIKNDGKVGIGTTSPTYALHVDAGNNNSTALFEADGVANVVVSGGNNRGSFVVQHSGTTSGALIAKSGGGLEFGVGANYATNVGMTLDSSGNLSTGQVTSDDKFTVSTSDWYQFTPGTMSATVGSYGMGNGNNPALRQLTFHVPNIAAYSNTGTIPSFGWYSNGGDLLMKLESSSGNLTVKGNIVTDSNSTVIATRKIAARDANGLAIATSDGTSRIDILNNGITNFNNTVRVDYITGVAQTGSFLDFDDDTTQISNGVTLSSLAALNLKFDTNNNDSNFFGIYANGGTTPIFKLTDAGAATFNNAFTFPTTDGSANQVLKTDGSGNVTWATEAATSASTSMSDTDGDTKIQFEESSDEDKIRFDTGGTERAVMSANNTTFFQPVVLEEPSPHLILKDTTDDDDHKISFRDNSNNDVFIIDTGSDNFNFTTIGASRDIVFRPNQVDRAVLNSLGFALTTAGVTGLVLNEDTSNTQNSARLFFEGGGGTVGLMNVANSLSFRTGMTVDSTSGTERFNIHPDGITAQVQFKAVDGNATTPGFSFATDTNTGLFRAGENVLSITTAAVERMRINGSGNVGIGTTSPSTKLEVHGTTTLKSQLDFLSPDGTDTISASMLNTDTLSFTGDSGQLFSITDSSTGTIFSVNDISGVPSIEVEDDGTIRLAETFGNVGIGVETPGEKLDVNGNVQADEFIGDLRGASLFKASAGEAISKGDVVYISGISGNTTVVSKADADDANKMPAFGIAAASASANNPVEVYTSGILSGIDTSSYSEGDELFVSTTAGTLTATAPTGESTALQKIGKVTRSHASSGRIFIIGAGRSNAVPNLNEGKLFVGNSSNQAVADNTMHVDIANSRVGIGTTSPSALLNLSSSSNTVLRLDDTNGTDSYHHIETSGINGQNLIISADQGGTGGGALIVRNNGGTEAMRIDSTGIDVTGNITIPTGNKVAFDTDGLTYITEDQDERLRVWVHNTEFIRMTNTTTDELRLLPYGGNLFAGGNLDVTGTVTADGLTVEANTATFSAGTSGDMELVIQADTDNNDEGDSPSLVFKQDGGNTIGRIGLIGNANDVFTGSVANALYLGNNEVANVQIYTDLKERLRIGTGGDISFYEDTGTTAKFFWDSSAEALMLNASTRIGTEILTVNGTVTTGGGTASSPALAFRADSNTGMFRPASQALGFSTAGTERMRIDSVGRAGIGTTSPAEKLDVSGIGKFRGTSENSAVLHLGQLDNSSSTALHTIYSSDSGSGRPLGGDALEINTSRYLQIVGASRSSAAGGDVRSWKFTTATNGNETGTSLILYSQADASSSGSTNTVDRVSFSATSNQNSYINTSGNFGLGNSNPNRKLHISGSGSTIAAKIEATDGSQASVDLKNSEGEFRIINDGGELSIYDQTDTAERLRIDTLGRVGIGTNNPLYTLDIQTTTGTGLNVTDDNGWATIRVDGGGGTDNVLELTNYGTTGSGSIIRTTGGGILRFAAANTEAMRINPNGNVAIGGSFSAANGKLCITESTANIASTFHTDGTSWLRVVPNLGSGGYNSLSVSGDIGLIFSVDNDATSDSSTQGLFIGPHTTSSNYGLKIQENGNIGIGTASPTDKLHTYENANRVTHKVQNNSHSAKFEAYGNATAIDSDASNGIILRISGANKVHLDNNGNFGVNKVDPLATFQVEEYGIETTTTTTSAATETTIDTFAAGTFRSARYSIQVTNTTDSSYHMTEILLIHNGTNANITEYGTIFTGTAAEATFDADINSGNVRLRATPASADSMTFKVVRHCITV